MKKTFLSLMLWILQLCFFLIVPLIIIWLQQGKNVTSEVSHKIPVTVIILILIIFLVCKKLMLNPLILQINSKIASMESLSLVTTDSKAIKSLKRNYRGCLLFQLIIDLIIPTLILAIILITIKAVEKGIMQIYGALCFCCISFAAGVLLKIVAIYSGKLEHEIKRKK